MHEPLVSIIIPTYKRPGLLERAIGSVLAQTYTHWEIVVVDDNGAASPAREATESFMQRYSGDPRIRYVKHERNKGLPAARNTGIRAAYGMLVAFLDDDDAWLPEKLTEQVALFARAPEDLALVYTGLRIVNHQGELIRTQQANPKGLKPTMLLGENYVHTPSSVMCRRHALEAVGLFDETLPSYADWDLYLRLSRSYSFAFVDKPLTVYYHHDSGRMTENYQTLIRAYDALYKKNAAALHTHPKRHAKFLRKYGKTLLRAGDKARAQRALWQSLYKSPFDRVTLRLLLELGVSEKTYAALRHSTRSLRSLLHRSKVS
jgi:glycosyltransferase involved in cell wall biosynthesis